MEISIRKPGREELTREGVFAWPVWEKEVSEFAWHYSERERCYFLEGKVEVTAYGHTWSFGQGDFVEFPEGMDCRWKILQAVRKHYQFG